MSGLRKHYTVSKAVVGTALFELFEKWRKHRKNHIILSFVKMPLLCVLRGRRTTFLPRNCTTDMHKVLRLPPENDTGTLTGFPKYCACHANTQSSSQRTSQNGTKQCYLGGKPTPADDFIAFCERRPTARPERNTSDTAANGSERTVGKHGPTPRPPNYKREPFATHSGKKTLQ